ncbi:MAG: hypothetical protein QM756_26740 [Polyangiaceae bacterium]
MKRLTEETFTAPTPEAKLAELLRQEAPYRANPFRKRLLLRRVSQAPLAKGLLSFAPAAGVLSLVVLGSVGVAAASYGWFKGAPPAPAPAVAPARPAPPPLSAPPLPAAKAEAAASEEVEAPIAKAEPSKIAGVVPRRERVKSPKLADGEDPSEVLEAIRALRKQGDAARAQVLLNQYLKSHPSGALTEQALVLSIEAALARHDPRATDYAKRYLSRFPNGRFRAIAQRVLNSPP